MQAIYQIDESAPTGTCGVAILGGERSLVANLGAANNYKVSRSQVMSSWDLWRRKVACGGRSDGALQ